MSTTLHSGGERQSEREKERQREGERDIDRERERASARVPPAHGVVTFLVGAGGVGAGGERQEPS